MKPPIFNAPITPAEQAKWDAKANAHFASPQNGPTTSLNDDLTAFVRANGNNLLDYAGEMLRKANALEAAKKTPSKDIQLIREYAHALNGAMMGVTKAQDLLLKDGRAQVIYRILGEVQKSSFLAQPNAIYNFSDAQKALAALVQRQIQEAAAKKP
jgi:hypothetical protein